jgi:hypothetical protein
MRYRDIFQMALLKKTMRSEMGKLFGVMITMSLLLFVGVVVAGVFLIKHCNFFSF